MRFGAVRTRIKPAIVDLGVASVQGIGILVILSASLQALGLDQIALAVGGSLSLIALGVATAASGNLGDIIAGVFLASDPDFGTGFVITTNGITGSIEHVDLRKTRIRTEDGKLHIIPNKSVEGNSWIVEQRPGAITPTPLFRGRSHPNQPPGQPPPRPPIDPGVTQPNRPYG
jgi:small conductance mechanosensitive channel